MTDAYEKSAAVPHQKRGDHSHQDGHCREQSEDAPSRLRGAVSLCLLTAAPGLRCAVVYEYAEQVGHTVRDRLRQLGRPRQFPSDGGLP